MIGLFIFLFLGGGAAIAFGIWEQKTKFADQHFEEAEVVGHQAARTPGLTGAVISAAAGMVSPVVRLTLPDGTVKSVRLHNEVSRALFSKFPELDVGGTVSVTYFGSNPREAFLTGHPLASKPMKVSTALILGAAAVGLAVVLLIFWLTIDI